MEAWNVYGRPGQDAEGFHNAMASGLVRAIRPFLRQFVKGNKAQKSSTNVDMVAVDREDEKIPSRKRQVCHARLETLVRGFEGDGDAEKLLRGVAYNYF